MLDVDFDVATRTGLQCAPRIHDQMGTSPRGTVRMSLGPSSTSDDVDAAVRAMREISAQVQSA
jgi:selenocysteine lyase/cysteine desulfurase